jgi:hypothetical protein
MASKRVESRKAVIKHFVRGEEAHTRSQGRDGHPGLASTYVYSTEQHHLMSNGVVVAIRSESTTGNNVTIGLSGAQVLVYPGTSVIGELVPELKSQGFTKALRSPAVDVWFKDDDDGK